MDTYNHKINVKFRDMLRTHVKTATIAVGIASIGTLCGCTYQNIPQNMAQNGNASFAEYKSLSDAPSVAPATLKSNNWSGYISFPLSSSIMRGQHHKIDGVKGTWAVANGNVYDPLGDVEQWVGLGGYYKKDGLIQAGTGFSDQLGYYAWYETLTPEKFNPEVVLSNLKVRPNDIMSCYINNIGNAEWKITIKDCSSKKEVSKTVYFDRNISTAEWIVESPVARTEFKNQDTAVNSIFNMHLTQFGSTYFGRLGGITGSNYVVLSNKKYSPLKLNSKTIGVPGVAVSNISKAGSFEVSDRRPAFYVNGFINGVEISTKKPLENKNLNVQLVSIGGNADSRWAMIFTNYKEVIPGVYKWHKRITSGGVTEYYQTQSGGGVVQCSNLSYIPLGKDTEINMMLTYGKIENVNIFAKYINKTTIGASIILERTSVAQK